MDNFCKICGAYFSNLKSLHFHIAKKEKLGVPEYYYKFFPRKDFLTFEQIPFKDYDQYFNSYFLNRANLSRWFERNANSKDAQDLALKLFKYRVKSKELKYLPSEVELRSSLSPSITGLEKIFGLKYEDIVSEFTLKRFDYSKIPELNIKKDLEILIDTREQKPLEFKGFKTKICKLDAGDYSVSEPYYDDLFIERKSVDDFFSTFGVQKAVERFKKELNRANDYGFYLIIMIEKDISECLNYYSYHSSNRYLVEYAFHNVKDLMQTYNNCQFVFCRNRIQLENFAALFFSNGQSVSKMDLQYLIDKRII